MIFIAEDNPILLQGLDRALSANGYQVATAALSPAAHVRIRPLPWMIFSLKCAPDLG